MKNRSLSFVIFGALFIGALFIFNQQNLIRQSASEDPIPDFKSSNHPILQTNLNNEKQLQAIQKIETVVSQNSAILNDSDLKKLNVFKEILLKRNDNDPRLDQLFKQNSNEFKQVIREVYQSLPMEARNERGTIAFLISRDIQSDQDVQFLETIFKEEPCLSVEDCKTISNDDPHYSGINQVSANYPQQVILYQLEHFDQQLQKNPKLINNQDIRYAIENLLRTASQFPVPSIQQKAEQLQKKFGF